MARIFNTYGPRMHQADGRVVSNFVVQALRGEPITIFGEGSQTRSFCYADDLIDGLIRLMESERGFTGPINLGNPNEFTIKELAEEVLRQTGAKNEIQYLPLPADDPKQRQPDISASPRKVGLEPEDSSCRGAQANHRLFQQLTRRPKPGRPRSAGRGRCRSSTQSVNRALPAAAPERGVCLRPGARKLGVGMNRALT